VLLPTKIEKYVGFIYYKRRNLKLFHEVRKVIEEVASATTNIIYLRYGTYSEDFYLNVLRRSVWGVWVGEHESQGFALQESLAMNVPLFVMNVEYPTENFGCPGGPYCKIEKDLTLPATSTTTWDSSCGEVAMTIEDLRSNWLNFSQNAIAGKYSPRSLIIRTLSPSACAARLVQLYAYHRQTWCEQYIPPLGNR
jgi:hypothetical protein